MRILHAIKKEFLEIIHDRTMLIVLCVFPVFIMIFMGSSFGSLEILGLPVGVVGPTDTDFASVLFADLEQSPAFNLLSYDNEEEAMKAFRNGRLRAIIVVPDDYEKAVMSGKGTEVRIVVDNSDIALQEAVLAAMSSVVRASSTNITKTYMSSAWSELYELNNSAAALTKEISDSREDMLQTKEGISNIQEDLVVFDTERLVQSLGHASGNLDSIQEGILMENESIIEKSNEFIQNASLAVNSSIEMIDSAHLRLSEQKRNLNDTITTLKISISALELLKNSTADPVTRTTLDLNIGGLESLKNSTIGQKQDVEEQMDEMKRLNNTLYSFQESLDDYSAEVDSAKEDRNETLSIISGDLEVLNESLHQARTDIQRLKGLLSRVDSTVMEINRTLDKTLGQTDDVNDLISSLQDTVAEQTGKDPRIIAAPLSVKVENQYERESFVDFIMPQVISISLLLSCFLLASISLVREKTGKTIVRLLMIPKALANMVIAKISAITLISLGQVGIILLIAMMLFEVGFPQDISMLIAGTVISAFVLSSIGMLIGFYARSESAAIQTSLLIAIPMLFLGNIIFSPDLLPSYTRALLELLPLAHITNIFKIVLITGGNPISDLIALFAYFTLLAILLAIIVYKRRDISDYT